jgi:hypothetical protein
MVVLALLACTNLTVDAPRPALALTLDSPTYGAFLADSAVVIEGSVLPADAQLVVAGRSVRPDRQGRFRVEIPFPTGQRAYVAEVWAMDGDARQHVLVPVFDGTDPRVSDPGALTGLFTPLGLDALEPLIADQIDALGIEDQLLAGLPALETGFFSFVPSSVTSNGAEVDLSPGDGDVGLVVTIRDLAIVSDITVAGFSFPLEVSLETVSLGGRAQPEVDAAGMLSLVLTDATVALADPGIAALGFDLPTWLADLLLDPVAQLLSGVADGLGDALLGQIPAIELGGPFAFDVDLLGTQLSARLVDVGASPEGLDLGITVATGGPAADTLPDDLAPLAPTTPSGKDYQLGLAVHEGLVNTLLDDTLASFLDIDLPLTGVTAEILGGGIRSLPGGDQLPAESEGYCIGLHAGDARVIRMAEGTGAPLARVWMPDVDVDLQTIQGGACTPWLSANVFATVDLILSGTTVRADFDIVEAHVTDYAAEGARWDDTGIALTTVVEGLAGLLVGQLSFDLGDLAGGGLGGLPLSLNIVSVEPLDDDGRWGVYLDVFGAP